MDLFFEGTSRIDRFCSVLMCGASHLRRLRSSLLHWISSVREKEREEPSVVVCKCKLCAKLLSLLDIKIKERRNEERMRSKEMNMKDWDVFFISIIDYIQSREICTFLASLCCI